MTTRKQATSCTNSSNNSSTSRENSSNENLQEKMLQLALRNESLGEQICTGANFSEINSKNPNIQKFQKQPRIRRSTSLYTRSKTVAQLENVKNLKPLLIENLEIGTVPSKLSRSKSLKITKNDDSSTSLYPSFSFKSFMAEFRENIRNSDDKMIDSLLTDSRQLDSRFTDSRFSDSRFKDPKIPYSGTSKLDSEEDTIFNPVKAYRNQRNFANVNLNASFGGIVNSKRQLTISRTRSLGHKKNNHRRLSIPNAET